MTRLFVLLSLSLLVAGGAGAAEQLYPNTGASRPATGGANVLVEEGKKGILVTMQCLDVNGVPKTTCWPLVNGTPSISIDAGAPITCANTLSPAPNSCGYTIGAFTPADPNVDTFKIFYNGIFPNTSVIKVAVTGATGSAGSAETNCPNSTDPGCTLSFTTGANAPRAGTSMEMIFDISGSMSQPAVPGGAVSATCPANPMPSQPVQRICALKLAASRFLAAYQPQTMLGDKLGIVFFSTTATSPGGSPNFVSAIDKAAVATISAQINAQNPTNSTAIGLGLKAADTGGFAADGASTNRKWVMLFTDGEQNVAPSVDASTPSQVAVGGTPYATGSGGLPDAGQIGVCPVTAGQQTAVGFTLLQAIANAVCNSQNAYVEATDQTFFQSRLDTYFAQLMTMTLEGDKFEISRDLTSTVRTEPKATFLGNARDRSFEILLGAVAERAGYKLVAPDGTVVPVEAQRSIGGTVAKVDFPLKIAGKPVSVQGRWTVVFDPDTFGNAPDYHLIVINDNPTIATTFTTRGGDAGTGEPLEVEARVLDAGQPLADAKITVDVTGPNVGLGNVLSKLPVQGEPPRLNGDNPGGAGARKLLILYNDPRQARLFATRARPVVILRPCASQRSAALLLRGCRAAGGGPAASGTYRGRSTDSSVEGHYVFTFHARGISANNGPFERTWTVALFVRPKPFGPKTTVQVQSVERSSDSGIMATLQVTPRDKLGSFIGPGYDGALTFVGLDARFPFAADNLDGSYLFRVHAQAGHPQLVLRALGQDVKTIDLGKVQKGQTL